MAAPTKRACDACHRRKVRCNGQNPCGNCSHAALACTYESIPQKKGPKGSRAKVISELRETQKQADATQGLQDGSSTYGFPPLSPTSSRASSLLTPDLINRCIDSFFTHMHPTLPILNPSQVRSIATEISHSIEAYSLISSLCAFILIQPGLEIKGSPSLPVSRRSPSPSANLSLGTSLLDDVLRARKSYDYIENPSVRAAITSFFLFGCCFGLNKHNAAWFHLREATALAQLLGLQDEGTYLGDDPIESSRRRRLFWLLFVTERAYSLQKHRPLTLHATIGLPTSENEATESGFLHLVNLYRPFDEHFVGLWNKTRSDCDTFRLAQLQQQLTEALPSYLNTTESQAADLRISQQWLRTMVWQLSITSGFLSSTAQHSSMTFRYPIEIARDLVTVTKQFSLKSMEVHGVGLIEKIFDVACTLNDVLLVIPSDSFDFHTNPRDYLGHFVELISTLRGGETRFLPLLRAKLRDTMPLMPSSMPPSQTITVSRNRMQDFAEVKEEANSVSSSSSPYSTPPFKHYFPLG